MRFLLPLFVYKQKKKFRGGHGKVYVVFSGDCWNVHVSLLRGRGVKNRPNSGYMVYERPPKVFIVMLVYMMVVCIGICVHFYVNSSSNSYDLSNNNLNLKLYRISELLLYPLTFSFIFPLYIYINNPSLRQYLLNYLKNDLTIM